MSPFQMLPFGGDILFGPRVFAVFGEVIGKTKEPFAARQLQKGRGWHMQDVVGKIPDRIRRRGILPPVSGVERPPVASVFWDSKPCQKF